MLKVTHKTFENVEILETGAFPIGGYKHYLGATIVVFGTSFTSTQDIMLQLNTEMTNKVLDKTAEYVLSIPEEKRHGPPVNELTKGTPCLALFDQDQDWYRARVIKKLSSDVYSVTFVDYGNVESVPAKNLMACPRHLIEYVEGVTPCLLSGFKVDESQDVLKVLKMAISEQDLLCRIDFIPQQDVKKWRMAVTLGFLNGKTLLDYVKEKFPDYSSPSSVPVQQPVNLEPKKIPALQPVNVGPKKLVQQQTVQLEPKKPVQQETVQVENKKPVQRETVQVENKKPVQESAPLEPRKPVLITPLSQPRKFAVNVDIVDGRRSLTCTRCGYQTKGKLDLVQHNLEHNQDFVKFGCEVCGYRSYSVIGLNYHQRIHTGTQEA